MYKLLKRLTTHNECDEKLNLAKLKLKSYAYRQFHIYVISIMNIKLATTRA